VGTRLKQKQVPRCAQDDNHEGGWLVLRKVLNPLSPVEAMELLIDKLSKTKANGEFLSNMSSL
jgi:transcription termination factor Rho